MNAEHGRTCLRSTSAAFGFMIAKLAVARRKYALTNLGSSSIALAVPSLASSCHKKGDLQASAIANPYSSSLRRTAARLLQTTASKGFLFKEAV